MTSPVTFGNTVVSPPQVMVVVGSVRGGEDEMPARDQVDLVQRELYGTAAELVVHLDATSETIQTWAANGDRPAVNIMHLVALAHSDGGIHLGSNISAAHVGELARMSDCDLVFLCGEGTDLSASQMHQALGGKSAVIGLPEVTDNSKSAEFIRTFYETLCDEAAAGHVQTAFDLAYDSVWGVK